MLGRLSILIVVALFASVASADLLWDNGIVPNGFNGRAISPPGWPDIRVADDVRFAFTGVEVWEFHANVIEDRGWTDGGDINLEVRADTRDGPGPIVATHAGAFTKTATGEQYGGRDGYDYMIEGFDNFCFSANTTYWLTIRNPSGGGSGSNYWMTSDGGADGPGSDTGWFSLDGGGTWQAAGAGWHHAFLITGTHSHPDCEAHEDCDDGDPCTIDSCVGDCCVNVELPGTCCGDNYCQEMTAEQCDLAPGCIRDPQWMCDGDTDGDGQVNPVDSGLVQAAFGSTDANDLCSYDIDCDGQINPVDSGIVQALFGVCQDPRDVCTTGGVFLGCEVTCEDDPCDG